MKALIFKNHLSLSFIKRVFRWHWRYYLYGRGTPLSAGVYIIDVCNYKCQMCDIRMKDHWTIYPRKAQEQHIDILSKLGVIYYSVSGGEPTLVPDLSERLAYASERIPYVHLVTNGSTMTSELATELGATGINEISVSLDGMEDFNNFSRGISNAFKKAWNAVDLLCTYAPNVNVVVNSVVTRSNLGSLRELQSHLENKFPQVYQKYLPLTFHELFLNEHKNPIQWPQKPASSEELKKFFAEAIANPKIVNSKIFLRKAFLYLSGQKDIIPEQNHCLYPYHAIEFDVRGKAYACITGCKGNGLPEQQNDIKLEDYLLSSNYLNSQKKLRDCNKCRDSMMLCYFEPRLNFPVHNLIKNFFAGSSF